MDIESEARTNKGIVSEGPATIGDHRFPDGFFDRCVNRRREDKEHHVVAEERDNEGVDEENPFFQGEGFQHWAVQGDRE